MHVVAFSITSDTNATYQLTWGLYLCLYLLVSGLILYLVSEKSLPILGELHNYNGVSHVRSTYYVCNFV